MMDPGLQPAGVTDGGWRRLRGRQGLTLLEVLCVIAILGVIILGVAAMIRPIAQYFQRSRTEQQANLDLRVCMDAMRQALGNGIASTSVISQAPNSGGMAQNQIAFQTVDGSSYTFTWSNVAVASASSVHMLWWPPGVSQPNDKTLANNVSMLHFAFDGPSDPGLLRVDFAMRVPLDASGTPDSFMTIMPSQLTIRMIAP